MGKLIYIAIAKETARGVMATDDKAFIPVISNPNPKLIKEKVEILEFDGGETLQAPESITTGIAWSAKIEGYLYGGTGINPGGYVILLESLMGKITSELGGGEEVTTQYIHKLHFVEGAHETETLGNTGITLFVNTYEKGAWVCRPYLGGRVVSATFEQKGKDFFKYSFDLIGLGKGANLSTPLAPIGLPKNLLYKRQNHGLYTGTIAIEGAYPDPWNYKKDNATQFSGEDWSLSISNGYQDGFLVDGDTSLHPNNPGNSKGEVKFSINMNYLLQAGGFDAIQEYLDYWIGEVKRVINIPFILPVIAGDGEAYMIEFHLPHCELETDGPDYSLDSTKGKISLNYLCRPGLVGSDQYPVHIIVKDTYSNT